MYYAAIVDNEKCSGCRSCISSCPDPNVIAFLADRRLVEIDARRCKGCSLCVASCNRGALAVRET